MNDGVTETFSILRFPEPEGGPVTVVYPILFKPGDRGHGSRGDDRPPAPQGERNLAG